MLKVNMRDSGKKAGRATQARVVSKHSFGSIVITIALSGIKELSKVVSYLDLISRIHQAEGWP